MGISYKWSRALCDLSCPAFFPQSCRLCPKDEDPFPTRGDFPPLSPVREADTAVTLTTGRWCGRGVADEALGSASVLFGDHDSLPELGWLMNCVRQPGTEPRG